LEKKTREFKNRNIKPHNQRSHLREEEPLYIKDSWSIMNSVEVKDVCLQYQKTLEGSGAT